MFHWLPPAAPMFRLTVTYVLPFFDPLTVFDSTPCLALSAAIGDSLSAERRATQQIHGQDHRRLAAAGRTGRLLGCGDAGLRHPRQSPGLQELGRDVSPPRPVAPPYARHVSSAQPRRRASEGVARARSGL